ncbi:MAG: hypothetical protein A3D92_08795 [Bacteroidetes bacterium RIFCSPHIGHO2_02_FULL_44_7]|nr:MAG: hypothetical protein A3D92_08795 [Bacteroidetes bacterium RIFCSPHIGHO2_02_FULL_44_7]
MLLFSIGITSNCAAQHSGSGTKDWVKGKIKVALIESTPTRPEEQSIGIDYIGDYRVSFYLEFSSDERMEIKDLLNKGSLWDSLNTKSCLFQPKYAIIGEKKQSFFPLYKSTQAEIVISVSPCGRAFIRYDGKESFLELQDGNVLEKMLSEGGLPPLNSK